MSAATYFISRRTFKSKSGKDCYMLSLVYQTRTGWAILDKFVDKPVFDDCASFSAGAAVDLIVDISGTINALELSTEFCPLPLGAEIA